MEPQKDKGPAKDIDDVLSEFGLGKYQIYNLLLIGLITSFSSISPISFSLTAGDLNYRCRIGECDDVNNAPYYEKWIENAIPKEKAQFSKCHRYNSHYYNSTINITTSLLQCPYKFHKLEITKCDSWIYETKERTILSDFDDVKCEENKWKLTSIGMMNNIGQFIGVPICGLLCDRFGRKTMMVVNIGLSSIFGIIKAFSISYIMFISFELLESLLSSGIYTTAFILGLELVTPEYRALAGTIIGTFYPLGEVMFGVVAWYFLNWRTDILVCYIPSLLFISYWW